LPDMKLKVQKHGGIHAELHDQSHVGVILVMPLLLSSFLSKFWRSNVRFVMFEICLEAE
jgi:hypothetical protein